VRHLKPILSLLRKEWRDTRALTIVSALLVPIALVSMNEGFLDWRGDVGAWFVVATTVLYVVVIAADLIAADVSSGRAQSYAALPVSAFTLWASKLAYLTLVGAMFFGWSFAITAGMYATIAPPDAGVMLWTELNGSGWPMPWLWLGAAAVGIVVFWSTILERGMAVIGAAVVTSAALGGLVPLVAWYDRELLPTDDALIATAVALPIVFLAGSLVGFVRGPHHASTLLRRLAMAACVPLVVLVPAGAVSAAVLLERLVVEPGDPDVRVAAGHASPDGRYLTLLASKTHDNARVRTWILDLEDGDLVVLPQRGLRADWEEPWNEDGSYVAWTTHDRRQELRREYDPETGGIRRTRSFDQVHAGRTHPYSRWAQIRRDGGEVVVTMEGSEHEVRSRWDRYPRCARLPGFVLVNDADGVRLHDLNTGAIRVLRTSDRRLSAWFSPHGEYVQIWAHGKQEIHATRTGESMPLPDGLTVGWTGGGASDHYAWRFSQNDPTVLVDLRTGWTCEMSPGPVSPSGWDGVRVLGRDRVLRIRRSGKVDVYDASGRKLRTVFDPHKER
jgi:hypothetical protein